MLSQSTGPTSGQWASWLNVLDSESPADALNYTCVVNNGLGKPQEQVTLLEIYGKLPFVAGSEMLTISIRVVHVTMQANT